MKDQFAPEDLNQITQESLEKLRKREVIQLTLRLRNFGIDLYERLNLDSSNSSKPPSSDSPYPKNKTVESDDLEQSSDKTQDKTEKLGESGTSKDQTSETGSDDKPKREPGRQPGSEGFWRKEKPEAQYIEHHYPQQCIICLESLDEPAQPYMGHYTYELERKPSGIVIVCTLHYYYAAVCACGHENVEKPGEGYVSHLEGRKRNVKLTEHTIVGPMLATFIAALSRRCGMSRKKIQEFLSVWLDFDLSVGLICKSIREAGIACYPVVDELVDDLQKEQQVHLDETPWYQKGVFCWLWVAISKTTAVYRVGTRKKTELLELITCAFVGWLITDGYGAYRSYPKRQRCLAHLIRKAIALTGAVSQEAQKSGEWFLREMRGLIKAMAQGEDGTKKMQPHPGQIEKGLQIGV